MLKKGLRRGSNEKNRAKNKKGILYSNRSFDYNRCTVYKVFRIKEVINMKIEKVNDNQIRCTLTREDLAERQIKLSELAYGTEKAKMLFRDMMQQAAYEFGFEADDIPLMIEAIPVSSDTVVLVVTKVEYPEELDTRFSRFSDPDPEDLYEDGYGQDAGNQAIEGADDILGLFQRVAKEQNKTPEKKESSTDAAREEQTKKNAPEQTLVDLTKLFVFHDLDRIIGVSHILNGFYTGRNDLYKDEAAHTYYLLMSKSEETPEKFNKVCNILSEYALQKSCTPAVEAFFGEHYRMLLSGNALQSLAEL